jgi:hypothetical protein
MGEGGELIPTLNFPTVNSSIVGLAPALKRVQAIRFDGAALASQQLGAVSEGFISMCIIQTSSAFKMRFCGYCIVILCHTYDDAEVTIKLRLLPTFFNTLCFAWCLSLLIYSLGIMLFEIHLVSNLARHLR